MKVRGAASGIRHTVLENTGSQIVGVKELFVFFSSVSSLKSGVGRERVSRNKQSEDEFLVMFSLVIFGVKIDKVEVL